MSGFTRLGTDNVAHAVGLVAGAALGAVAPLSARLGGPRPGLAVRALGALCALALALCPRARAARRAAGWSERSAAAAATAPRPPAWPQSPEPPPALELVGEAREHLPDGGAPTSAFAASRGLA